MKPRHAQSRWTRRSPLRSRRGAVIPLVAVFVVVMMAMAAFSIDVAYIELVQTQLKAATDAAAKAGTSALVQGQTSSQAMTAAINMANNNIVAGHGLKLTTSDISVGQSQLQNDGSWLFVAGAQPYQAMQITANLSSANANGAVGLFFAPALGTSSLTLSNTSVASAFACDVCLCLDRSGSMKWDLSGTDWMYPAPYYSDSSRGSNRAPVAGSRWHTLDGAVQSFTNILSTANAPPKVAVVTWASDDDTDLELSTNMTSVYNAVHYYTTRNFSGGTGMSDGMSEAYSALRRSGARTYAKKIMILISDGDWNEGSNPETYASTLASNNITVHTISFLASGTGTTVLRNIANTTGGKFYSATDSASLTAAWQDLAYSLPIVLTK